MRPKKTVVEQENQVHSGGPWTAAHATDKDTRQAAGGLLLLADVCERAGDRGLGVTYDPRAAQQCTHQQLCLVEGPVVSHQQQALPTSWQQGVGGPASLPPAWSLRQTPILALAAQPRPTPLVIPLSAAALASGASSRPLSLAGRATVCWRPGGVAAGGCSQSRGSMDPGAVLEVTANSVAGGARVTVSYCPPVPATQLLMLTGDFPTGSKLRVTLTGLNVARHTMSDGLSRLHLENFFTYNRGEKAIAQKWTSWRHAKRPGSVAVAVDVGYVQACMAGGLVELVLRPIPERGVATVVAIELDSK